jgi:uncharacterized Zn-finger protein
MQTRRRLKRKVKAEPRVKIEPHVKAEERKGVTPVKTEESVFSRKMPKLEVDSETRPTQRRVRNTTRRSRGRVRRAEEELQEQPAQRLRVTPAVSSSSSGSGRPFSCSECGKDFKRRSNLKQHERVHTGEKPFACPRCDFRYSRKGHLTRHLRAHTGEKPFECSYCDFCCSRKNNLTHVT